MSTGKHYFIVSVLISPLDLCEEFSEAARTPMLLGHNLTRQRLKSITDLGAPRAAFESLSFPCCLLDGRNVFPCLVIAQPKSMVQRIEHAKFGLSRRGQHFKHIWNATIRFRNSFYAFP